MIDSGFSSDSYPIRSHDKRKPKLEDFVFYAEAQRVADREQDGKMYTDSSMCSVILLIKSATANQVLPTNSNPLLPESCQLALTCPPHLLRNTRPKASAMMS